MKRRTLLFALLLCFVSLGAAQAQVDLVSIQRSTSCELQPTDGPLLQWADGFADAGPYTHDLDVTEGAHSLRSIHDSIVAVEGGILNVTGTYAGTLATTDPGDVLSLSAAANLMVNFVPGEGMAVDLEVQFSGYGEVYFFDLTEWDGDFDHVGPGTFELTRDLIAGHEYLFQVFHGVDAVEGAESATGDVALAMTVAPRSVPVPTTAWGAVKSLFR